MKKRSLDFSSVILWIQAGVLVVALGLSVGSAQAAFTPADSLMGRIESGVVVLDKIVNMGKNVWTIIKDSKPVVSTEEVTADALPQGTNGWSELESWEAPVSKVYRMPIVATDGTVLLDFNFRITFTPGGRAAGKGHYLANIGVSPDASITVGWSKQLEAKVFIPTVTNVGTAADPIAAAQMQVQVKLSSPFTVHENSAVFYIRGDQREIHDISAPDAPEEVFPIGHPTSL